jgi:hypothetical protein
MNVNFGQNLMQTALQNFMAGGALTTQGPSMLQTPIFQQMAGMQQSSFAFGAGFSFGAVGGMGGMMSPGFLSPPMGTPAGFAQQMGGLQGMQQPWNMMGNLLGGGLPGMMGMPNPQQMMQQLTSALQSIAGMLNMMAPQMQMMNQLNQAKQAASLGQNGIAQTVAKPDFNGTGIQQPGTQQLAGRQANFPGVGPTDFLNSLPNNADAVAKKLNVSGRSDVQHINNAVKALKTAAPQITTGAPKTGKANLSLTPAEVEAIRNAKSPAEAKSAALKAISRQTGVNVESLNINDQKGIRDSKARDAVNKLLGTNIRNGVEKNSGSSLVLDSIAESIAKSVRGGDFGSTKIQSPGSIGFGAFAGFAGAAGGGFAQTDTDFGSNNFQWGGAAAAGVAGFGVWHVPGQVQEIPNPASGLNINLGQFTSAADEVARLASPLIFDLENTGLQLTNPQMIQVDIDGDGTLELITDLDAELGLLVFDSKGDGLEDITGADMFGDNTDLSKYGINAPSEDGKFKDGFQALRALCEHLKIVDAGKQYLDQSDLAMLEDKVGLRMRVGGMLSSDDRRFSDVGVTHINLGNPKQTQHIEDAPSDRWGNKVIYQDGAKFIVYEELRKYADIWFKIQARYSDAPAKQDLSFSKVQLMSRR